jgi:hypothetical protein
LHDHALRCEGAALLERRRQEAARPTPEADVALMQRDPFGARRRAVREALEYSVPRCTRATLFTLFVRCGMAGRMPSVSRLNRYIARAAAQCRVVPPASAAEQVAPPVTRDLLHLVAEQCKRHTVAPLPAMRSGSDGLAGYVGLQAALAATRVTPTPPARGMAAVESLIQAHRGQLAAAADEANAVRLRSPSPASSVALSLASNLRPDSDPAAARLFTQEDAAADLDQAGDSADEEEDETDHEESSDDGLNDPQPAVIGVDPSVGEPRRSAADGGTRSAAHAPSYARSIASTRRSRRRTVALPPVAIADATPEDIADRLDAIVTSARDAVAYRRQRVEAWVYQTGARVSVLAPDDPLLVGATARRYSVVAPSPPVAAPNGSASARGASQARAASLVRPLEPIEVRARVWSDAGPVPPVVHRGSHVYAASLADYRKRQQSVRADGNRRLPPPPASPRGAPGASWSPRSHGPSVVLSPRPQPPSAPPRFAESDSGFETYSNAAAGIPFGVSKSARLRT